MWTRNYPRRGPGIISTIFWFPIKVYIFIVIAVIMTGFYVIGIAAWIVLVLLWELLKLIFKFLKYLFVSLFHLIRSTLIMKGWCKW